MRHLVLLGLVPVAAAAQDGPSFDCAYASTRTELAICASPDLAAIERAMVVSYDRLVVAVGERDARRIADRQLERRQACEGDAACIAQRLLLSAEVFDQRARAALGDEEFARMEDILRLAPGYEDLPDMTAPEAEPLAAPPATPPVALDSAADDTPAGGAVPPPPPAAQPAPAAPVPVAEPDAQAAFDTPLSWAWMDLERADRESLQRRLADAGVLQAGAATTGAWTQATLAALRALDAQETGFDASTREGADVLLDWLASDAFAAAHPAPAGTLATDDGDPLAGTSW